MTHELVNIPEESVEDSILLIRTQRVILDRTLAKLYGVSTKVLNQAVKRNAERFPPDFMFQLTMDEARALKGTRLRSQVVTLKEPRGRHTKYLPFAFTEHGILMLSSVLKSDRAVLVNIQIMRTFVRLREMLVSSNKLHRRVDVLEAKYDRQFKIVFDAIRELIGGTRKKRKQIGFRAGDKR